MVEILLAPEWFTGCQIKKSNFEGRVLGMQHEKKICGGGQDK
jgi:hypothetical protein